MDSHLIDLLRNFTSVASPGMRCRNVRGAALTPTLAVLLFITGCSSMTREKPAPYTDYAFRSESLTNEAAIENLINDTMYTCGPRLARFARIANRDGGIARTVSLVGLVAGTIVAPTLTAATALTGSNAVWVAGFSALAGATNEASQTIADRGFSGTGSAQSRAELAKAIEDAIAVALDGTQDISVRRAAALKVKVKCQLAAPVAQ